MQRFLKTDGNQTVRFPGMALRGAQESAFFMKAP